MRRTLHWLFIPYLTLIVNCLFAQAPPVQWTRCYGGNDPDKAYSIVQASDGGYIVAGFAYSTGGDVVGNHGGRDYWILKTDALGNLEWQKCLGGSSNEAASCIQKTFDGGFIISGSTFSNDGDVSGLHGVDADYWIVKIDSIGTIEWQKCLGGSSLDEASVIRQTSDSGYIVGGNSHSNDGDVSGNHDASGNHRDYWVVKLNNNGNIQWQKCYGGSDDEWLHDIRQTSDGNYAVAGSANSTDGDVTINQTFGGVSWILKLDSTGNIIWENGRTSIPVVDTGFVVNSILETSNGGFIVVGRLAYHFSINHLYYGLAFLDSGGTFLHAIGYGDGRWSEATAIDYTSDGGYIICGWNDSAQTIHYTWLIVKIDSAGLEEWREVFRSLGVPGDQDIPYSVHETIDGGFIVAGNVFDAFGTSCHAFAGTPDYGVVKLGGTLGQQENAYNKSELIARINNQTLSLSFSSVSPYLHFGLSFTDITGRTLYQTHFKINAGTNDKEIFVGDLANGIYFVTLSGKDGSESIKVFKE